MIVYKKEIDHSDVRGKRIRRSSFQLSSIYGVVKECIYNAVVIYRKDELVETVYLKDLNFTASYMLKPYEVSGDLLIQKERKVDQQNNTS